MRRAFGPLRHVTARQPALDVGLGVHRETCFPLTCSTPGNQNVSLRLRECRGHQPYEAMISCRGVAKKRRTQEWAAQTVKSSQSVAGEQQALRDGNHLPVINLTGTRSHSRGRIARGFRRNAAPQPGGSRECRVRAAPAVSCARLHKEKRTGAYRFSGGSPAFPAQGSQPA